MTPSRSLAASPKRQFLLLPSLVALLLFGGSNQASALEPTRSPALVQLLIPLLQGDELKRLQSLAPGAVVVEINGGRFVRLGSFADARVAYRLGRAIQRRFKQPFDLAYEPGHPQLDGAWLAELGQAQPPTPLVPQPSPDQTSSAPASGTDWAAAGVRVSRAGLARNPELDYLLVSVQDPAALQRLQLLTPVQELLLHDGMALARVGVFTRSSHGQRLLEQRLLSLRGLEQELELLVARNGTLVAIA